MRDLNRENLIQGIGDTGVGGLKRREEDTWVIERSRLREALHTPGAKEEVGAAEWQRLGRWGAHRAGSQISEESGRLGWCRECGEKMEAGERNHWGNTHETRQISWRQRGVGSSSQEAELWGQVQGKMLSLVHATLPRPACPPGQPGQPPLPTFLKSPSIKSRRATLTPWPLSARDA